MLVTSVVSLVTRPAVEKRSMLEKENSCIWPYMASRRFFAKPVEAIEACFAAIAPQNREAKDTASITSPTFTT